MPPPTSDDYLAILQTLADHGVEFIVIGGVCAVLHGAPVTTFDLDLVHSRSAANLPRLLAALETLDAYYREQPDRRLRPALPNLASEGHQLLMTRAGTLDLLGRVTAKRGYDELLAHTEEVQLRERLKVRILDLPTLIELKQELARDKDQAVLGVLRRTLEEKAKREGELPPR
jgi:predicted nucleotidyltransferase